MSSSSSSTQAAGLLEFACSSKGNLAGSGRDGGREEGRLEEGSKEWASSAPRRTRLRVAACEVPSPSNRCLCTCSTSARRSGKPLAAAPAAVSTSATTAAAAATMGTSAAAAAVTTAVATAEFLGARSGSCAKFPGAMSGSSMAAERSVSCIASAGGTPWAAARVELRPGVVGTSIRLQSGHEAERPCRWIQTSMHSLQNSCMHGSKRTSSPTSNSLKQMAHVSPPSSAPLPSSSSAAISAALYLRQGSAAIAR
mmetsp:Transcript_51015/g.101486  ORF Transcript_51015/g.101486 Transcript_51015/m.101486 type:complete len:254 (+) Transcript_51015:426-1187(+)